MTTVTLLAGERTIGGTQIVVEDEGARLIFDCGIPFSPATNPFTPVRRRPGRELADLIALGIAPYIPDLYGSEHLAGLPASIVPLLPPTEGPVAVALSHSHLDHSQLAGFVRSEIPLLASEPAARIVQVLSDARVSLGRLDRPIADVAEGETVDVGPMKIRLLAVDHDVAGARGMIIETTGGVIAYSGDLRLHGRHPMHTLAFAGEARRAGACLLILEGTRLAPPPEDGSAAADVPFDRVEADVAPDIMQALERVPDRLGVVLLTPENGERVEALARAADRGGRLVAMDWATLALTVAALGEPPAAPFALYVPDTYETAEEPGASGARCIVSAADIAADPGGFVLCIRFERFADLVDMVPAGGGGMIISANGTPLGPFDPAWKQLEVWATVLGMELAVVASTGHAAPHDLGLIAAHTGASTVMSIHSRCPDQMPVPARRLLLPERGLAYDLATLA